MVENHVVSKACEICNNEYLMDSSIVLLAEVKMKNIFLQIK